MRKQKGFTLIELLVVIAIIGLLSTLAVVSLNNARAKARDAKRVSDIKQISTLIEMEAANTSDNSYYTAMGGAAGLCTVDNAVISTCTIGTLALTNFADPSTQGTACVAAGDITCDYTVSDPPTALASDNYELCVYLEDGAGGLPAGYVNVSAGGQMNPTCPGL